MLLLKHLDGEEVILIFTTWDFFVDKDKTFQLVALYVALSAEI